MLSNSIPTREDGDCDQCGVKRYLGDAEGKRRVRGGFCPEVPRVTNGKKELCKQKGVSGSTDLLAERRAN